MNEKQAKLLRYFERASNNPNPSKVIRSQWRKLNHRQKGKLMRTIKYGVVGLIQANKITKTLQLTKNLEVLKGFTT